MKGTFLFLGTGASAGVPVIGCRCDVCKSSSPFNRRLRPSGVIEIKGKSLLLDAGPDLRQQALAHGLDRFDGILLTHTHYDHISGIDELRAFYLREKKPLSCLLSQESLEDLKQRYCYLFRSAEDRANLSVQLEFEVLKQEAGSVVFKGVPISYCSYFQGNAKVTGYRIGNFAYISDIRTFDESIFSGLKDLHCLVVSALRFDPSPVHFSIQEAIAFATKVGAKQTWITHISHHLDHQKTEQMLPPDIRMGYDGLKIEFSL